MGAKVVRVAVTSAVFSLGACAESKSNLNASETAQRPEDQANGVVFGAKPDHYKVSFSLSGDIHENLLRWNLFEVRGGEGDGGGRYAVSEAQVRFTKEKLLRQLGRPDVQPEGVAIEAKSHRTKDSQLKPFTLLTDSISGSIVQVADKSVLFEFEVDPDKKLQTTFYLVDSFTFDALLADNTAGCVEDVHFTMKRVPSSCAGEDDYHVAIYDSSRCEQESIERALTSEAGLMLACSGQVRFKVVPK